MTENILNADDFIVEPYQPSEHIGDSGDLLLLPIKQIQTLNTLLGIILLAQYFIYYKHAVKTLVFTVLYFAIMTLIDFSSMYSVAYISKISIESILLNDSLIRVITIVFSKFFLICLVFAMYKLVNKKPILPKQYLLALLFFSLLIFILSLLIGFDDIHSDMNILSSTSFSFFIIELILVLFLLFGILKITKFYENKEQISLLTLRNQMLEKSMKDTEKTFFLWKKSLHDYKHNIFHLMTLAENNNLDEIKKYLNEENNLLLQKLFYYKTGNDTVDTIVNVKQALAHESGITFLINASVPVNCCVCDIHLCAILGNLIDNAINASKKESEPYIEVSIKQIKDFLIIKITNRFTQKKCNKQKHEKFFHGIGLKSIRLINITV